MSTTHHCKTKTAASPCSRFTHDSCRVFLVRRIVNSIPKGSNRVTAASIALPGVKSPRAMNDCVIKNGIGTKSSINAMKAGAIDSLGKPER